MRSRIWIIVTAALLLSAFSDDGPHGPTAPEPFTDFDTLTMGQSAGLYGSPVFEVTIFSDGLVRHSGPTFERTGGPHESRIDRHGLAQIANALREARVDEMRNSYQDKADGCESTITDMWTLSLNVSRSLGYRNKSVELYTGCLGPAIPTERIHALINSIDQVTRTRALLEQRKQVRRSEGGTAEPST